MAFLNVNSKSEEQATQHLFTKMKYNLGVNITSKLIGQLRDSKERIVFIAGKHQHSYPAIIVRSLTNVKSNVVHLPEKYSIEELKTIFEIVMNLQEYKCHGLTQDYSDWKPITSIVNMIDLANELDMTDVEQFLKNVPELFTEHNKNAFNTEVKRRQQTVSLEEIVSDDTSLLSTTLTEPQKTRSRTKSRTRSLSKLLHRSLSRGRKYAKM